MRKPILFATILTAALLSGCSFSFSTQSSTSRQPARNLPTATNETATPNLPGEETADDNVKNPPESEGGDFSIYLIALSDKGASGKAIGCDDSVVPVQQSSDKPSENKSTRDLLTEAYQKLLSIKERNYGESGFINALDESELKLNSVEIKDSQATVKLTGKLVSRGVCDDPRIKAQLEETALQFPEIKTVDILINGKTLAKLQDLKGE